MYGFILTTGLTAFSKGIQTSSSSSQLVVLEEFEDDDFDGLSLVVPVRDFFANFPLDLNDASKTSVHTVRPDILHQTGPPQT